MPELKPELLPCPFCEAPGSSSGSVKRAGCLRCGFTVPRSVWNRRPPSELERLARAFFGKVTEIGPIIDGIIGVQTARGYPYTGPNWKAEYDALAAFLAEPQVTK